MGNFRLATWAGFAALLALGSAHADSTSGGIPAGIGAFTPGSLPNSNIAGGVVAPIANFQTCAALGMAGGMGASALGGLGTSGTAIGSLAGLLPGGATAGACQQPDSTSLNVTDCTNYQDADGTYDPAKLATVKKQLTTDMTNANCEVNEANAVKTELQCFQQQGNALVQQANQDQAILSNAINQAEQEVTLLKSQESDRTDQLKDVGAKLNGDSNSTTATGKEGLLKALSDARTTLSSMSADATGLTVDVQTIQQETLTYQNTKTARVEALAVGCFTTQTSNSFRCVPNGPPVSAEAYALCRVQQNAMVGANGLYQNSQSNQEKAAGQQTALQSLFAGMFGTTSSVPDPSASPDLTGATPNLTIAQLEAQYTSQLSAFNGNGLNIQNFVLTALNACNNTSATTVAQEETTSGTLLNNMQVKDTTDFNTAQLKYKNTLEGYRQRYNQWYSDLSGQEINLPVDQCEAVGVTTWNSCLANTQAVITGLINGTSPESQIPLTFAASRNTNMTIQMQPCKGLSGCVNDLQSLSTGLTHDLAQRVQGRTNWVLQANQSVTTMAKNMAANYSQQSTMVNQQLSAMQGVLSQLGIKGGFNFQAFPPETPQFNQEADGSNGLIKAPTNLLGFMNNFANPQILNISADGMSGAMDNIAEKQTTWKANETKIADAQTQIAAGAASCAGKAQANLLTKFDANIPTNCGSSTQFCQSVGGALGNLGSLISGLSPGAASDAGTQAESQLSGAASSCTTSAQNLTQAQAALDGAKKTLANDTASLNTTPQYNCPPGTALTSGSNCCQIGVPATQATCSMGTSNTTFTGLQSQVQTDNNLVTTDQTALTLAQSGGATSVDARCNSSDIQTKVSALASSMGSYSAPSAQ